MRFYYFPNTVAVAVAIALEEAGLAYEPVRVDFKDAAQTKAPYLSVNPKGRVPSLETEGQILTETGAILDYIAAICPKAGLSPTDPLDAAHMRAVMYYLASTMHINHAHKMRGHRWATQDSSFDDMRAKVPQTMRASATYVEDHCLRGQFVLGTKFSVADAYLFAICNWLEGDGVPISDFPKIARFWDAMLARPSIKAVQDKGILKL